MSSSPWPSTVALLCDSAKRFADRVAIDDGVESLTYRALEDDVHAMARGLIAKGVRAGDRVLLWAPNSVRWIVATLALHSVEAILVPINTRFRAAELAYVINKVRPRLVLMQRDFLGIDYLGIAREAMGRSSACDMIFIDQDDGPDSWSDLRAGGMHAAFSDVQDRMASVGADTVCDIMFTSGTTGFPRGVIGTHGRAIKAFHDFGTIMGVREGDNYLVINPFFHSFGYKCGWLLAMMFGATVYPLSTLDAMEVLRRVERDRITILPGPPTVYQALLTCPARDDFDLSSLRVAVTGATEIPNSLARDMHDKLGFDVVLTAYALTEATAVCTVSRQGDDIDTIVHTSGRPLPDVEIRIIGKDGVEAATGETGEIQIRGYNVMNAYFEDPEATAEVFSTDGWLLTGDVGSLDERGYVRVLSRLKDMFIVGGFNAYPAEIENALVQHPDIVEAAVIGIPDERLGEVGYAFVVPVPGTSMTEASIVAWARDNMANYKVPRRVAFLGQLPRNASGKILKTSLRDQVQPCGTERGGS